MQIRFFMAYAVNIDRKKGVYSDSSIPEAATFFPMSAIAIVKPSLENRADNKADMPDYQNVEMIAAILTLSVSVITRDTLICTVLCNAKSLL